MVSALAFHPGGPGSISGKANLQIKFFSFSSCRNHQISFVRLASFRITQIISPEKASERKGMSTIEQGRRNVWGHEDWSSPCFQNCRGENEDFDYQHCFLFNSEWEKIKCSKIVQGNSKIKELSIKGCFYDDKSQFKRNLRS